MPLSSYRWLIVCGLIPAVLGCAGARVDVRPAAPADLAAPLVFAAVRPGRTWVRIDAGETSRTWTVLTVTNRGEAPAEGLSLWNPGDEGGLLHGNGGAAAAFSLLPGERLACASEGDAGPAGRLRGSLRWELPARPDAARACLAEARGVQALSAAHAPAAPGEAPGLLMTADEQPAVCTMIFTAPFPMQAGRIGLQTAPPDAAVEPWLSLDGRAWARLSPARAQRGEPQLIDLTAPLQGQTHFALRLILAAGTQGAVRVTRLWVEREFETPGALLPDPARAFCVDIKGPQNPKLEIQLWAETPATDESAGDALRRDP
jgi:hypothetical protein